MNNLISLARRAPKTTAAIITMVAAAVIIPASLFAWGPSRDTYTMEKPANHVTFNSITNNPNYGDERNFVTIKPATNKANEEWTDTLNVENGKEYYVRMYVHNNAAANLNLVAHNVKASVNIPDFNAKRIQIDGYISSSNASPANVWDQAVFTSDNYFNIKYVDGSAVYTNNIFTNGTKLSDNIDGSGATLGYTSMNGDIPGCMQYTGIVTFKVKAAVVTPTIEKTVRINGTTDKTFKESVNVKPGALVDYQIHYKNTSGQNVRDVVIKDALPAGVTYQSGTSYLLTSTGSKQIADGVTTTGVNIGGFDADGDAYIKFTAKVTSNDKLAVCGTNTLTNTATVITDLGSASDTAKVTTTKTGCTTPSELPKTGASDGILSIIGLGTLATTAAYYIASRRSIVR